MSIEEALNLIMTGEPVVLVAVRAQGKRQGELYSKKARYGPPDQYERKVRPIASLTDETPKQKIGLHIDNGTIPMTDVVTNEYFSPNVYHIIEINDRKVYK
jgi:hypothetical protein